MADVKTGGDSQRVGDTSGPMTAEQADRLLAELSAIRSTLNLTLPFLCAVAGIIAGKVLFWMR